MLRLLPSVRQCCGRRLMSTSGGETYGVLNAPVDRGSPAFQANYAHMKAQVDDLRSLAAKIADGGPAELKARHRERNKMMARERIDSLVDVGCVSFLCCLPRKKG